MILRPLLLAFLASFTTASTLTLQVWPLSAPSPTPYAYISLTSPAANDAPTASISQLSTPSTTSSEELVRIGYVRDDGTWTGVATAADSFAPGVAGKVTLHVDAKGLVRGLAFSSFHAAAAELQVQVVSVQEGAEPILNKPVVLNADGRMDKPVEDQRSFLQKYWWAIGLFLLIQVVGGGGGEK